ncbi:MAG: hypothetical protein U5K73_09145 [Halofilum sp. (in: g-proteobacteria)]|nr:hypothetical protein [Halofilum sp. (in: g-proteobacteria)]
MRVDPDARFDLALDGDRLTLTGRAPDQPEGDDSGSRSASDESVAALDVDAANEAADDSTDSSRPVDSGDNGATASGDSTGESDTATGDEPGTKAEQTAPGEDVNGDTDSRVGDGEDPATTESRDAGYRGRG